MKNKLISLILALCLLIAIPLEASYKYNPFTRKLDYYEPVSDSDLGDLGDVTLTGLATGNILYYNGTAWVNLATGANTNVLTLAAGIPSWAAPGAPAAHAATHLAAGADSVDHDLLLNYLAAQHLTLPAGIAAVLTDHNLLAHTALGLFDASADVDHNATTNYFIYNHVGEDHLVDHNIWIGWQAGQDLAVGGQYNTLVGEQAGTDITTGDYNTIIGFQAGFIETTGFNSTFVGYLAGMNLSNTNDNTAVGYKAMWGIAPTGYGQNVAIGSEAFTNIGEESLRNTVIGVQALEDASDEAENITAIGYRAAANLTTPASNSVLIGSFAGLGAEGTATYEYNVIIGVDSGGALTTGSWNTVVGNAAALSLTTGAYNIIIGDNSGAKLTTNSYNVLIGRDIASVSTSQAHSNVIIGDTAAIELTNGYENVIIGKEAARDIKSAGLNVIIGWQASLEHETGNENTIIGNQSGKGTAGSSNYAFNTFIGSGAAQTALTAASNNVVIGYQAAQELTTGTNNIVIGYMAGEGWLDTESEKLVIDVTDTVTPLIYGDFSADNITINGDFSIEMDAALDQVYIHQGSESGTESEPLIFVDDAREGATVDEWDEASLYIAGEGWGLAVIGKTYTQGDATWDEDIFWTWGSAADHAEITQTNVTGTDGQPLINIDDDRTGAYANAVGEATIVMNAAGTYALYIQTGQAYFDANANFTEDIEVSWADAADSMTIYQASATGTENVPLVQIVSEAEGVTVDENLEAVLRLTTETGLSWALFVESGKAEFEGDFLINWDAALDHMVITQTDTTGTDNQALIFIDDDRTGVEAQNLNEATLHIDAEGVWAIYVEDGNVAFQTGYFYAAAGLKADEALWSHGAGDDILIKWDLNGAGDDLYTFSTNTSAATSTAAMFYSEWSLNPTAMTDHDDYLSPSFVIVNWEAADANDYSAVVIGERTQASVLVAHYFDFYAMTGAIDGSVDPANAELAAIFRIGASGSATPTYATTPGDVLFEGSIEVDGDINIDGEVFHGNYVVSTVVNFDDASPLALCTVADGYMISHAFVEITTVWDGNGTIVIGDGTDPDGFMEDTDITQTGLGYYGLHHDERGAYLWDSVGAGIGHEDSHIYTGADTIDATLVPGTSTQGVATIHIVIVRLK